MALKGLLDEARERERARRDPELHHSEAPPGYRLRGVSTLRDGNGRVVQSWTKTTKGPDLPGELLDAFRAAVEDKPPATAEPVPPPRASGRDLMTVYPMGDPHIGMLAWHAETGEDFDLPTAVRHLTEATQRLVSLAPESERAAVVNLGDFFHSDDTTATTRRSGHRLDVDTRWGKILHAGVAAMVACVDAALAKHRHVEVVNAIGNHDDHSAVMLSVCLEHHYSEEPRVTIHTDPAKFHYIEHGMVLLGITHGDTCKAQALPGVMATDQAEAWGRTRYRYWLTGHIHHETRKEHPGCIVESFRTLAGKDAYHAAHGYRAGRSMVCDVYHAEYGRIMRHEVGVEVLRP